MNYAEWKKPPSDFTIYRDYRTLEGLISHGRKPAVIRITPGSDETDIGQDDGCTYKVQKDQSEEPQGSNSFDQTLFFAWPLSLKNRHKLADDTISESTSLYLVYPARSLACSCFNKSLCSITLRVDDETTPQIVARRKSTDPTDIANFTAGIFEEQNTEGTLTHWRFQELDLLKVPGPFIGIVEPQLLLQREHWSFVPGAPQNESPGSPSPYLFSARMLVKALYPAIFRSHTEHDLSRVESVIKHGLIVISGQTGTLKSTILRGLAQEYLASFNFKAWGKRRYPHILTIEDPIEKPLVPLDSRNKDAYLHHADQYNINFTPRQLTNDLSDLSQGLKDALRQTPAVVIVGETRDLGDWIEIMKFAATGHLCFTTAHAGSLVETMRTIIEATKSSTPDRRSSLVEKLIAVVHLRTFPLVPQADPRNEIKQEGNLSPESMLLPAIWRNLSGGGNFFVSDGLSAILPRRAEEKDGRSAPSCRGRSDMANTLLHLLPTTISQDLTKQVLRVATRADLEGI